MNVVDSTGLIQDKSNIIIYDSENFYETILRFLSAIPRLLATIIKFEATIVWF